MRKLKQDGFSAPIVVLAVIIIAAILLVGYYAYHNHHKVAAKATSSPKVTVMSSPSPTPAANILKIPQLGIELTLPDSIKDAEYVIDANGNADFSTKSLEAAGGPTCAAGAQYKPYPIGQISVSSSTPPPQSGEGDGGLGQLIKQLGTKYLYYNGPQAVCTSQSDPTVENLEGTQTQAFKQALSTAVLSN